MRKDRLIEIIAGIVAAGVVIHFYVNPADVDMMKSLQRYITEKLKGEKNLLKSDELGNGSREPSCVDSGDDDLYPRD